MTLLRSFGFIRSMALSLLLLAPESSARGIRLADSAIAIVGATLIDGNGGQPVTDAVVIVVGKRITAAGPRSKVTIPDGARIVDGTGKYLVPGFIDTNVHLSIYSGIENFARYEDRFTDIAIEGAQLQLKYGITTVRDSYGMLQPLLKARDRINKGEVPGARMLVAGNIVGWGGPWSITFGGAAPGTLSLLQEQTNDAITQGAGEELINMTPDALRVAMDKYLDKGVDFVKFGGTTHAFFPAILAFSEAAQKAIVEETHKYGKVAETHSTSPEGLRLAVQAGVDLVQHPEATDALIPDETIRMMVDRQVICSMLENGITGKQWTDFQKRIQTRADSAKKADSTKKVDSAKAGAVPRGDTLKSYADSMLAEMTLRRPARAKTTAEIARDSSNVRTLLRRRNAERLIQAGCIVTASTDNYRGNAPEFSREPSPAYNDPGIGSIIAIEGLVELGMTPGQAIVAATRNGAVASRALDQYGTVEAGKSADLLLLAADPLADIRNIRKLVMVMKEGAIVDVHQLPLKPVFYRVVPKTEK